MCSSFSSSSTVGSVSRMAYTGRLSKLWPSATYSVMMSGCSTCHRCSNTSSVANGAHSNGPL
jgi:hypothetical protein